MTLDGQNLKWRLKRERSLNCQDDLGWSKSQMKTEEGKKSQMSRWPWMVKISNEDWRRREVSDVKTTLDGRNLKWRLKNERSLSWSEELLKTPISFKMTLLEDLIWAARMAFTASELPWRSWREQIRRLFMVKIFKNWNLLTSKISN